MNKYSTAAIHAWSELKGSNRPNRIRSARPKIDERDFDIVVAVQRFVPRATAELQHQLARGQFPHRSPQRRLSESGIGQSKCELAALLEIPRERDRPPIRINANDVALHEILQILIGLGQVQHPHIVKGIELESHDHMSHMN